MYIQAHTPSVKKRERESIHGCAELGALFGRTFIVFRGIFQQNKPSVYGTGIFGKCNAH